jgi:integrase/recombinase XerD
LTGPGHWSLGSTLGGSTVDVPLSTSTVLATRDELFSANEQLALAGFLAGYSGLTRDAYTLDLRQYVAWCTEHRVAVFGARRADIECFARHLESLGRARATIARRLCTVACFYRYAEQECLISVSPAAHVRRPRLDYESHATGLDRNEVGAMLVAAGLAGGRDHALISLLALNGLRVSEAIGTDVEDLGLERGHRTLTIVRKGGKVVTVPLAPRTARAIDLAVGERCDGPIFVGTDSNRIDRHAAGRIVRRIARRAGIAKRGRPPTATVWSTEQPRLPIRRLAESVDRTDCALRVRGDQQPRRLWNCRQAPLAGFPGTPDSKCPGCPGRCQTPSRGEAHASARSRSPATRLPANRPPRCWRGGTDHRADPPAPCHPSDIADRRATRHRPPLPL